MLTGSELPSVRAANNWNGRSNSGGSAMTMRARAAMGAEQTILVAGIVRDTCDQVCGPVGSGKNDLDCR